MTPVLVVCGGISGIAAALEVQPAGLPVVVRGRGPRLGGRMAAQPAMVDALRERLSGRLGRAAAERLS